MNYLLVLTYIKVIENKLAQEILAREEQ